MRRLNALLMLALLVLGPFLHAHFGKVHTDGFHLDGLQWHSHSADWDATSFTADDDHDSPSVGVTSSMTRTWLDTPQAQDLISWSCALVLTVLACMTIGLVRLAPLPEPLTSLFAPGASPPALAPPAHA